jgi:hypothetical protein
MHRTFRLAPLFLALFASGSVLAESGVGEEPAAVAATAKLRLLMKEPIASYLNLWVVEAGGCRSVSEVWVTGGKKRTYVGRIGMLDSSPEREGIVELEVPADVPIGFPTRLHVAKIGWGKIMFALNPATHQSVRDMQPGLCEAPVFTPRAGGQYEVSFEAGPGTCRVEVAELSESEGEVLRTPVAGQTDVVIKKAGRKKFACGAP